MQSEVKCKSSYYVYRCATETKLCQCASTLYIHRKSQQTVHEVARVGYFCLSSNPLWTTARFSVSSDTGVKCVAGVSFVTSLVPTTTCPTTPTHYIYQVTVRTSDVARCMQSTDCAPDRDTEQKAIHKITGSIYQLNVSGPFKGKVTSWQF